MTEATQFLVTHGWLCVFAVVFWEQRGLPVTALPFLLAAGASAAGKFNPLLGIGGTVHAGVIADAFWFYLGRRPGHRARRRERLEPADRAGGNLHRLQILVATTSAP